MRFFRFGDSAKVPCASKKEVRLMKLITRGLTGGCYSHLTASRNNKSVNDRDDLLDC